MLILFNLRGRIFSLCSVQIRKNWEIHWRFWNPNGRLSEDHHAMLVPGLQLPLTWLQCEHFKSLWPACEHGHVKPHIGIIMLKLAATWWMSSINSAYSNICCRNICCHGELIMPTGVGGFCVVPASLQIGVATPQPPLNISLFPVIWFLTESRAHFPSVMKKLKDVCLPTHPGFACVRAGDLLWPCIRKESGLLTKMQILYTVHWQNSDLTHLCAVYILRNL